MKRIRLGMLAGAAAGAVLLSVLWADDQRLALRVWSFRLPGTELGMVVSDMNGDGPRDLVIAHMTKTEGLARSVSWFQHGTRGQRFPNAPTGTWAVPADGCAFAAGDFDPAPGGEVAVLCPTRVVILRRGKPVVLKVAGFFDYPENGGLPPWDLARDLDGDGIPELVVPTKQGYTVFGRVKGKPLAPRSSIEVPVTQRFGPAFETVILNRFLSSSLRLRRVVVCDMNGDKRLDLVAYLEGGLARFLQRKDGTFPAKPDQVDPLELVKNSKKTEKDGKGEADDDAFSNVRLTLTDIDGDDQADLIATETVGKVGVFETLRTRQVVFRGVKGKTRTWNERQPDAVLNLKGVSGDPVLVDWDGDGKRDLVLSSYRMDMFTNVKRALLKSMTIEYLVFRQQKGPRLFKDDPDLSLSVEVPLETIQQRGGHKAVLLEADLNGDSIRDMVARRSDGGLKVVLGKRTESMFGGSELGFDEARPIKLAVGATEPPWVVDLDGDGKDELILEPFGGDDANARVVKLIGVAK